MNHTLKKIMLVNEKYELIQTDKDGNETIHGIGDTPSQMIEHYYKNRKQYGYMTVVGQKTRNQYATLGSK